MIVHDAFPERSILPKSLLFEKTTNLQVFLVASSLMHVSTANIKKLCRVKIPASCKRTQASWNSQFLIASYCKYSSPNAQCRVPWAFSQGWWLISWLGQACTVARSLQAMPARAALQLRCIVFTSQSSQFAKVTIEPKPRYARNVRGDLRLQQCNIVQMGKLWSDACCGLLWCSIRCSMWCTCMERSGKIKANWNNSLSAERDPEWSGIGIETALQQNLQSSDSSLTMISQFDTYSYTRRSQRTP